MVRVDVEHCGLCASHSRECRLLQRFLSQRQPGTVTECRIGRRGSFEVVVEGHLVHSKLRSLSFPDHEGVLQKVRNISKNMPPPAAPVKQQPICMVM